MWKVPPGEEGRQQRSFVWEEFTGQMWIRDPQGGEVPPGDLEYTRVLLLLA